MSYSFQFLSVEIGVPLSHFIYFLQKSGRNFNLIRDLSLEMLSSVFHLYFLAFLYYTKCIQVEKYSSVFKLTYLSRNIQIIIISQIDFKFYYENYLKLKRNLTISFSSLLLKKNLALVQFQS